jgi:hypothetical protein
MLWFEQGMVGMVPMFGLQLWMVWKCTSYTDWDGEWSGKVPGVWLGLWKVLLESAKDWF